MEINKQKLYFFDNLIHMGFVGKVCSKTNDLMITSINNQLSQRLIDLNFNVKKIDKGTTSVETIIKLIFSDVHFVDEYIELLKYLIRLEYDKANVLDLTHFILSKVSAINKDAFSLKSASAEGNLTNVLPFDYYENDPAIYVDVFTVPQIDNKTKQVEGFQGIFPIANTRRETYLKNKKDSELHIFHNLISDLPNNSSNILNDILKKSSIESSTHNRIKDVSLYLERIYSQTKQILKLFSDLKYSNKQLESVGINEVYNKALLIEKKYELNKEININIEFDQGLKDKYSLCNIRGIDFILSQIIESALKKYAENDTELEYRLVNIYFINEVLRGRPAMRIKCVSNNIFIHDPQIINRAGIQPLRTSSTGLGFYFLNRALELLKTDLPLENPSRHFDLKSTIEGVQFDIYYYSRNYE